jgi:hypothetical protein
MLLTHLWRLRNFRLVCRTFVFAFRLLQALSIGITKYILVSFVLHAQAILVTLWISELPQMGHTVVQENNPEVESVPESRGKGMIEQGDDGARG